MSLNGVQPNNSVRKIFSVFITALLAAGTIFAGATPARALTVTLGNSDQLIFDHSTGKYTNIVGTGTANNDVVLYKNVVTVSGIAVDAVITTILNGGTISNYDAIGSASTDPNNFQLNASIGTAGGTITARFAFYEAGTYTGANTGTPIVLQNVRMTSIDIDASGSSDFQFTEFTGFQKYTLNSPTNLVVSNTSPPKVRFTATSNNNNSNIPQDKVLAKYDSVQTLDVVMGNVKIASTNYFGIAFGPWTGGSPVEVTNSYNSPPTSSNTSTYVATGQPYVLPKSIFGNYADADSNPFNQVIIKTLPGSGTLEFLLSGVWTAVTANQVITIADIELGKLRFTGSADTSITFQVHDGLSYSTSRYTANFLSVANAQTITFNNPGSKAPSQTFASGATANSGLTVTLTSNTPGVCTVSGLNIVTVSNGLCEIQATQAGNTSYGAAAPVTQIFPVSSLTPQTITFNNPGDKALTVGTVSTSPTASSGLTVTLTSLTPSVCTVSGTTITLASKGLCQIRATQPGNGTYAPASPVTQEFLVTAVAITITAPAVTVNYGDSIPTLGNPTFGSGFVNGDTSAVLTTQPTCVTTYTATSTVAGGATTTCSGAVAANYTFTYVDTPVTINKAPVVITASSTTVDYGDSVPTITATYSGFKNSDGSGSIDTAPTCTTTYTTTTNFGTNPTTSCSGALDANYSFTYVNGAVTINKAPLVVTASSHSVNTGDSTPAITASYSGFVNSQTSAVVSGMSCSTTYTSSSVAGNYTTSCIGGSATNYEFSYVTGLVTATAAGATSQTITFNNPGTKTYGPGFTLASPPTATSGLSVTITSNSPTVCTVSGNVVTIVGVGTCSLSANQGGGTTGGTTYNPAATVTITFTVSAAPLVVTASSITVTYRDNVPAVTNSISGFVLGQDSSVLVTSPTCVTTFASTDSVTATRTTSCSGGSASNYSFSYTAGSVTINKATLTVTASSHTVIIGDSVPTVTASYSGLRGTDTNTVVSGQSCATTYSTTSIAGSYPTSCSGGSATNYNITYVDGTTRATTGEEVLEQSISLNTPGGQTYGNANFSVSPSATSGLTVSLVSNTPEVCLVDNGIVRIVGVGVCSITASQPGNTEYLAAPNQTITFNVAKATIRVVASSHDLTQGDKVPTISASLTGFVNGESRGLVSGLYCSTFYTQLSTVGSYATNCSGASATNYIFVYVSGSVEVAELKPTPTPTPTETSNPNLVPSNLPSPTVFIPVDENGKPLVNMAAPATIDLGDGIATNARSYAVLVAKNGLPSGARNISQLAKQPLSGFASGTGIRIEVIGAKTTGQFIVSPGSLADPVSIAAALDESTSRTATNFAKIETVKAVLTPDLSKIIVGLPTKDAKDLFEASNLANPQTVGQLRADATNKWLSISASVTTYKPGSVVYLTVTSEPVIFGAAVVDKYGKANFAGLLPVDLLQAGGHNIRIVGIRNLDGVSTDETGQIQLTEDTLIEIQRFDQGTKATIKVFGANVKGGLHAVIREVPLMKYEPWWTVWLAIWTTFLVLLARRYGKVSTKREKSVVASLMGISVMPALYLGWTSSTYAIMFWGTLAGLIGAAGTWYLPVNGSKEDRVVRARIKQKVDQFEDQISDKIDELRDRD